MDPNTQAVLAFLGAIRLAQERLSSLNWFDERLHSPFPHRDGKYRPLAASGQTIFMFNQSVLEGTNGSLLIRAHVTLGWAEAFYNEDRVKWLAWQIELSWNDDLFTIDPRIVADTANKYQAETDIFTLPDRLAPTLKDCIQELAQATTDLMAERDIIYTLLR